MKGSGSGVKAVYGVTGNTAEAARETGIELVDQVVNLRFGQFGLIFLYNKAKMFEKHTALRGLKYCVNRSLGLFAFVSLDNPLNRDTTVH